MIGAFVQLLAPNIMIPVYALITHLVTLLTFLVSGMKGPVRYFAYVLASFIVTYIVSMLILSDYLIYAARFYNIDPGDSFIEQVTSVGFEYLYNLLNYIFRIFTDDFNYLRSFIVFVALGIKIAFLLRWSPIPSIALIFYISVIFYPDSYLLRSTLASSILLIGFWALMENKPSYLFFLPVAVAAGFHFSALVVAPLWFLRNTRISENMGIAIFVTIFVAGLVGLGHPIVEFLLANFSNESYISARLSSYTDSVQSQRLGLVSGALLLYSLITLSYIFFRKKLESRIPKYNFVLVVCLYSLAILVSLDDFAVIAERTFRLTAIFIALALGHVLTCFNRKSRVLMLIILVSVFNIIPYITNAGPFRFIDRLY